jgi:hypothetical protein
MVLSRSLAKASFDVWSVAANRKKASKNQPQRLNLKDNL